MSGNADEDKESQKGVPLDLARSQMGPVRTVEGKPPLIMTSQTLRSVRVLQGVPSSTNPTSVAQTIITANIMPQGVLKQDSGRTPTANVIATTQAQSQVSGNLIQRPTQITLSSTPLVAQTSVGTSYHVPRGPAVVANLAAPRCNVTTVRTPLVVTAQSGQAFVRPARTPSPAQGTAWLTTSSSNGSQIKGAPTVLSSPVRGATVTGKPQIVSRAQPSQTISTIRPGTILQNTITIGQPGQIHSLKSGTTGIQALGNTVTIAQMIPNRTQAVVYSANTTSQFTSGARISVPGQKSPQTRPVGQVTTARLTVPVNVSQARLVTPQATVLTSAARLSTVSATQSQTGLGPAARIATTQPSVTIGRISVPATPAVVSSANILGQTRISTLNLHSLVAVANNASPRNIQTQGAKVITQPVQGTVHLAQLQSQIKTTVNSASNTPRTINVPAAIATQQRSATVVPSQAISIAKVIPSNDGQSTTGAANVFIHTTPLQSAQRRTSPGPANAAQPASALPSTTVSSFSHASGTYYYDTAGNYTRPFVQQPTAFATFSQHSTQQVRPPSLNSQGLLAGQHMRFNSMMVVDQNRTQYQQPSQGMEQQEMQTTKITSSPRPSILRKRDHEGSPLKVAKNLTSVLQALPVQTQGPLSPPPRPDSRGNGHSSGGSTTISATSSPGLAEVNEDSNPPVPMNIKEEDETKPPIEMSPRKKPRKQQLTGNDMDEHNDDMQFISESTIKKENEDSNDNHTDEPKDGAPEAGQIATVRKPASASLLNSYRQTWKATHNHYQRYSDVRPKDERRPTIMDLANQYRVQEKVNGWKIHHLSTQMEDLADQEQSVYNQLMELLKYTESEENCKDYNKEINRVNELIKGNLQRIKIINDGMIEAKTQIMKIFDHKIHVTDIINRCASKRNFKKREKS